jgi:hypothetical protein
MREAWVVFLGQLYFKALSVLILLALGCIFDKKIQPYVQLSVVFQARSVRHNFFVNVNVKLLEKDVIKGLREKNVNYKKFIIRKCDIFRGNKFGINLALV